MAKPRKKPEPKPPKAPSWEPGKHPGGRPTLYRPEYVAQAGKLCALGATTPELADFFGVDISTVSLWLVEHKEFSEVVKREKEIANNRVEESLYRRAMGYEHDEVDIRVIDNKIVQTKIRKHYPPDAKAMIFWMKNRRPREWRDKIDTELTGADGAPLFGESEETLRARLAELVDKHPELLTELRSGRVKSDGGGGQ